MTEQKPKLGYKERDKLFKKYFTELKIKVALNWFEIFALTILTFFVGYKLMPYVGVHVKVTALVIAGCSSLFLTLLFCYIRKYKLTINRFDKEHIYKRLSSELLEENKH
ncbi:MAG: hypothetical protein KDD41_11055 [Flavobacteriales bacterium]|nr:hypothetical protein [Flavobacteriales bacterium]